MALPKHERVDMSGLELLVEELTATLVNVDAPATDTTWVDVQTALDDIAARLAVLEAG